MKNIRAILIFFSLISSLTLTAQQPCSIRGLVPFRQGNLWGYSDTAKRLVIKPQFSMAFPFAYDWNTLVNNDDQYATVIIKGNKYRINSAGKLHPFLEKKEVVKTVHDEPAMQLKVISENGKQGVTKAGEMLIHPFYEKAIVVNDELERVFVKRNGKWGMLGYQTRVELPIIFDTLCYVPDAGYNNFLVAAKEQGKWKLLNYRNQNLANDEFDALKYRKDNINVFYAAKKNEKWALLDQDGNKLTGFDYDDIDLSFSLENLFLVTENGKKYYINCKGTLFKS